MRGWVKLHRCLTEKAIWLESTPEQKSVLIALLTMANHREKEWEWKGEKYKAEPGQFVTSLESVARKSGKGISVQNVRTSLKRFEKYGFLTNESTNKNRLITITNWEMYQSKDEELTSKLTSNQQATNKQLTTNKNDKNEKNDKKKSRAFKPPSLKEVKDYCIERENTVDPERFIDFYETKGWMVGKNKMKDWKAAVRNWERRSKESGDQGNKHKTKNHLSDSRTSKYSGDELEAMILRKQNR